MTLTEMIEKLSALANDAEHDFKNEFFDEESIIDQQMAIMMLKKSVIDLYAVRDLHLKIVSNNIEVN